MHFSPQYTKGFTLLELIVGIVVLAISFSVITSFVLPQATQSANQIHQIRAAELGQSLINEILSKAFDENSDKTGGIIRCNNATSSSEPAIPACTGTAAFGPDSTETRTNYDDVDDYHCQITNLSCQNVEHILGTSDIASLYQGYSVLINVAYDDDYNDTTNDNNDTLAKRITITITTPTGEKIVFSTYKVNF